MLTAYTAPIARLIDPHVDVILVGDSLGMVVYGFTSTLPVTIDMMIAHGRAVVAASSHAADKNAVLNRILGRKPCVSTTPSV